MFSQKLLFKAIALTGVMAFPCLSVPTAFSQEPNIEDFDFEGFLGGNVWEDENENGFQGSRSAPEQGIEDVSVTLTDNQGKPLQTTTTNKNGFYYFRGLEEGDYSVQFERPENCEFTQKDRYNQYDPRFDYWDSDADKDSGTGETIRIDREHRFDFTSDAGIVFDDFPAPQAPMLYPDAVTLNVGETVEVDVLANDQLNGDVDEFFIDDRNFPGKIQIDNALVIITADFLAGEFGVPYSVVVNGQLVTSKLWVTIEKPATLAVDDQVSAFVGDQITADILANDIISEAVDVVRILGTDVPGRVFINRANNLVVRDTRATGSYKVEYEVISTDGSRSTALVNIVLEERPIPTVANDDAATGLINEPLVVNILDNDQPSEKIASVELAGSDLPKASQALINEDGELVIEGVSQAGTYTIEYDLLSTSGSADNAWVTVTFKEPEPVIQECRAIGDVANLIVQHSQKSVEVAGASQDNGADIQQSEFINGANQQWELLPVNGGFSLQARHSGQCLEASDENPQNGANVIQAHCGESGRQILNWQGDQLAFKHSGLCLTMQNNFLDNGASFVQSSCQNTDNQRFFAACLDNPAPKLNPPAALKSCSGGRVGNSSRYGGIVRLNVNFDSNKGTPFAYRFFKSSGEFIQEIPSSAADVNIDPNTNSGVARFDSRYSSVPMQIYWTSYEAVQVVDKSGLKSKKIECDFHYNASPIALDINHTGTIERINTGVNFDFTGNGQTDTTDQWFAPSEGILIDTRFEGDITGKHLFGDEGGQFTDGYAKLATLDSNKNGWVEGVELNHLGIWTDTNSNAKVDSGELSTLANHNVVSLSTAHMNYLSQAKLANGQTMLSEDVWFSVAAPAVNTNVPDTAELTTNELTTSKSRLPIVLSVLAIIFSGFTIASLIGRRKKHA